MGAVKRILMTGASGFVGRATVAHALAQGIEVVAVVRSGDLGGLPADILRCDLSQPEAIDVLARAMPVDAVIHAAAPLGGSAEVHARDSLRGTEHVLTAMQRAGMRKLVHVSSLGVYDTAAMNEMAVVNEASPLEQAHAPRDAYTAGKLGQEALVRDAGISVSLVRPGAIYGANRLWNGHIGTGMGPVLVQFGQGGEVPVVHVDRVAEALVKAAGMGPVTVNLLDDDLPDRRRFVAAMRNSGWPRWVLPVPWQAMMACARLTAPLGQGRPGLLRPRVIKARIMPLRYSGEGMAPLGLGPQPAFEDLFARAVAASAQGET